MLQKCLTTTPLTSSITQTNVIYNSDFWKAALPVLKAIKNTNFIPNFLYSKSPNPYYMYIKINEKIITLKYDKSTRIFNTYFSFYNLTDLYTGLMQTNIQSLPEYDISYLFHYIECNLSSFKTITVTDKLTRFLYRLTNGNYQNLIHLSILCANMASPEILTSKLFLVTYHEINSDLTIPEYFCQILDFIFNPNQNVDLTIQFPTIKKFVTKKYIPELLKKWLNGTKLFLLEKGGSSLSEIQRNTLCQYIKGSRINIKDTKLGSISYRNFCPIICFSKSHKETVYLEQNFPCIKIDLSFIDDYTKLETPHPESNPEVYEWLRICLPLYGLYLLGEKKFHNQPLPKKQVVTADNSKDTIISEFLNICCMKSKNKFEYTDSLYDAYTSYYQSVYKSQPLNRAQFVKAVKQVPGLIYKRPHTSRTVPNKYAFMGICLKSDWKSCFTTTIDSLSLEEETFKKHLQNITSLLPNITV